MTTETIREELVQSMMLCRADLLRHGYGEKEVELATWLMQRLMATTYALGTVNEVDPGKIMACIIKLMQAMDQCADQQTGKILGKPGPLSKN